MRLFALNLYPIHVDREVMERTHASPYTAYIIAESQEKATQEIYTDMHTEFYVWDGSKIGSVLHAYHVYLFAKAKKDFEEGLSKICVTLGIAEPRVYNGKDWKTAQALALAEDAKRIANDITIISDKLEDNKENKNNGNSGSLRPKKKAGTGGTGMEISR